MLNCVITFTERVLFIFFFFYACEDISNIFLKIQSDNRKSEIS